MDGFGYAMEVGGLLAHLALSPRITTSESLADQQTSDLRSRCDTS
jgi:hypothetical protein